ESVDVMNGIYCLRQRGQVGSEIALENLVFDPGIGGILGKVLICGLGDHLTCIATMPLCGWSEVFRVLKPAATIQSIAASFWSRTSPLLEKEGYVSTATLVPQRTDPFWLDLPRLGSALAAGYGPVNARQVDVAQIFEERLE